MNGPDFNGMMNDLLRLFMELVEETTKVIEDARRRGEPDEVWKEQAQPLAEAWFQQVLDAFDGNGYLAKQAAVAIHSVGTRLSSEGRTAEQAIAAQAWHF